MNPVLLRSLAPAPTRSWQRWAPTGALLLAAGLLTGCANVRTVEAQVQSYTRLAALPQPPSYRLELLPSQQAQAASFATIEQQAQQALAKVGLQRDDAQPRLLVQISAQARTTVPKEMSCAGRSKRMPPPRPRVVSSRPRPARSCTIFVRWLREMLCTCATSLMVMGRSRCWWTAQYISKRRA